MQSVESQSGNSRGFFREWVLPIGISLCITGLAVTGTMWWAEENYPAVPPAKAGVGPLSVPGPNLGISGMASTPAKSAAKSLEHDHDGDGKNDHEGDAGHESDGHKDHNHEPPASLTEGKAPAQQALALGNWYYDHENWPRAISHYQQAIAGGLNNADVLTDLGNCYRFSKLPQRALDQYRLAQKKEPGHEQSLFNQGGLYHSALNDKARAIAIWQQYLKRFPKGRSAADAKRLIREAQKQRK